MQTIKATTYISGVVAESRVRERTPGPRGVNLGEGRDDDARPRVRTPRARDAASGAILIPGPPGGRGRGRECNNANNLVDCAIEFRLSHSSARERRPVRDDVTKYESSTGDVTHVVMFGHSRSDARAFHRNDKKNNSGSTTYLHASRDDFTPRPLLHTPLSKKHGELLNRRELHTPHTYIHTLDFDHGVGSIVNANFTIVTVF